MIYSLDSEDIVLEELNFKDVNNNYLKWLKNKETSQYLVNIPNNIKKKDILEYIESIRNKENFFFKIIYKDIHVGNTRLGPLNFSKKKSGFGILIGDTKFRGKKIAVKTIHLLKDFLFDILNFEILEFECVKDNIPAMSMYKKMGFKQRKTNKKFIKKNLSLELTIFYMKKKNGN